MPGRGELFEPFEAVQNQMTREKWMMFGCITFTSGQTCTESFDWSSTVCKIYNYEQKV
jgi:hypothetical protein